MEFLEERTSVGSGVIVRLGLVQVGIHPTARQHADDCNVPVKNFDVFTDLLEDIRSRCKLVIERKRKIDQYEKMRLKHAQLSEA